MNSRTLIYSLFIGLALLSLGTTVTLPNNMVNMASAQLDLNLGSVLFTLIELLPDLGDTVDNVGENAGDILRGND